MFSLEGCRANVRNWTRIIARTMLASALLLGVTTALHAQPVLVETQVEAGNFDPRQPVDAAISAHNSRIYLPTRTTPLFLPFLAAARTRSRIGCRT
jgi:hypothetical protein